MVRVPLTKLLLVVLILSAGLAGKSLRAEDAPSVSGKASDVGGAKSTGEKSGEVQIFKPPAEWLDLGIWTLMVFGLLLIILRKFAWTPMKEGLQRREHNIRSAIEEAQKAREEAQRMREQWQSEVNRAHDKVREILDEARRNAQHTTEEMVAKARGEIQGERERLRKEIETAKDQALQELWNQTAQLASVVSAKAIRRQLSPEDHRRLVDEALVELEQVGSERQRQLAGVKG